MKSSKEGQHNLKSIRLHTRSTSWLSLVLILLDIFLICLILLKIYPLGLCPTRGNFCEFVIALSAVSVAYFIILLVFRCRQINEHQKLQHWRNPQNVRAAAIYGIRTIFVIVWVLTACLSTALWSPGYLTELLRSNTTFPTEKGWRMLNCSRAANFNSSANEELFWNIDATSPCINLLYHTASVCLILVFVIAFLWLVMVIFMTNFDRHIGKKTTQIILKKGIYEVKHSSKQQNQDKPDYEMPKNWPIELEQIELMSQDPGTNEDKREQLVQDSITRFKNKLRHHTPSWSNQRP